MRWASILGLTVAGLGLLVLSSCVTQAPSRPPMSSVPEPLEAADQDPRPVVFTDQKQYIEAFRIFVRRKLVIPPGTPASAGASIDVVVSPTGEIRKFIITQPSGYPGYDRAIERAIFQAQPLPVMEEWVLSNRSERLTLKFKASE